MENIKVPHTFVIIFSIIILVAIATWFVPAGEYNRVQNAQGRTVVAADSFHEVERNPQGVFAVLEAPVTGMEKAAEIIAFILIIGGAFNIIYMTGAINAAISKVAKLLSGKEIIVIPIIMLLFSMGGAVFGMSEETIPFVAIFVPFALALGYDSIVGMAMPFVGAALGFAGAMLNPFTVGIAQGIAELPPFSGVGYRTLCWAVITIVGIAFVMIYARAVKKNPERSPVYELDLKTRKHLPTNHLENVHFKTSAKLVIITFGLGMVLLVFGVMKWGWYIKEICALFIGLGIVCGILGKIGPNNIAKFFTKGAADLVGAALVVGLARGILVVAQSGRIIDTLLHSLSNLVADVPTFISSWIMFMVETTINFFIPSGSGQAALTIPIMAPLGDLIGVTRQVVVLAYQFGDGFSNMIIPTSGVLLGCLYMAKIPWSKWARWMLPLQLILIVVGCALLTVATLIGFGA
ncbi:MAG: YfcC family protein [Pseudomonadota bacterium]